MPQSRLQKAIATLKKRYGPSKPRLGGRDLFGLIMADMVAEVATDEHRAKVFADLKKQVGITPRAILNAPLSVLVEICRRGGPIAIQHRAERMQIAAAMVIDDFGGDLSTVLALDYKKASRELQKLPSVAESGSDRMLMIARAHPVLGLESNAVRVLARLGYGGPKVSYTKWYRLVRDAAMAELKKDAAVLEEAALLLREHGKTTCKTSTPHCEVCPITAHCEWYRIHTPRGS